MWYCVYTTLRWHKCVNKKRDNNRVSLKTFFCATTSFHHRFKSQFDSSTAEPKPSLLIPKRHFKTSNKGTLSCFIKSLLYYCIKSSLYYDYMITCIWYSIHSSVQSHIHNKSLDWMSTKESNIFVALSFHLLRVISDDRAAQCICCLHLTRCWRK